MRWQRAVAILAKVAINHQIVNISNVMAKGPFWNWQFWRKWQKWRLIAKLSTTHEIRWQRARFKGGDFGENGRNDEQSPNS